MANSNFQPGDMVQRAIGKGPTFVQETISAPIAATATRAFAPGFSKTKPNYDILPRASANGSQRANQPEVKQAYGFFSRTKG